MSDNQTSLSAQEQAALQQAASVMSGQPGGGADVSGVGAAQAVVGGARDAERGPSATGGTPAVSPDLARRLAQVEEELAQERARAKAYEEAAAEHLGESVAAYQQVVQAKLLAAKVARYERDEEERRAEGAKRMAAEYLVAQSGGLLKVEDLLGAKDPVEMSARAVALVKERSAAPASKAAEKPEEKQFLQPASSPAHATPSRGAGREEAAQYAGQRRGSLAYLKSLRTRGTPSGGASTV